MRDDSSFEQFVAARWSSLYRLACLLAADDAVAAEKALRPGNRDGVTGPMYAGL
jgi:hypothetical protein